MSTEAVLAKKRGRGVLQLLVLFLPLLNYIDLLHSDGDLRLVSEASGNVCDLVNRLHTRDDLTESRVLTVEMGRVLVHNEELAGCRVGIEGSRHRDNASLVLDGVADAVCAEFALDVLLCAAHSVAERIAALDHKARDNSVEGESVVEALGNELLKILNRDGCRVGVVYALSKDSRFP